MPKNTLLKDNEIGIVALGGLGEVGKNMYVYEIDDKLFVVDAGVMFPDDSLLGVNYVIQDYTFLRENEERIVGLFISHGHEDHIGGIPFLLRQVKIPKIYASGIAVDLIEYKVNEHSGLVVPPIDEFKAGYKYTFGNVEVSFIRVNHSIPDSFGIVFKTKLGNIFHTGDFKIDLTPVGPQTEFAKLSKIATEGVLCMLSDSTNAERPGVVASESKVGSSISDLFNGISGRIIIATFASNMYRIQQIIEAAIKTGRKLCVFGRSMERAIDAGMGAGYIKVPKNTFVNQEELKKISPEKLVLLCTGSQGEPLAALSRIAAGSHRNITTVPGDTVIFSSSPIPGNQDSVNKTINLLYRKGVEVVINGPLADTHVSGHGNQFDLQLMLNLVRPTFFIPMHGEYRMLKTHKNLAIDIGIPQENVLVIENGDYVALSKNSIRVAGRVPASNVYLDGSGFGGVGNALLKERRHLSEEGLFIIALSVDLKKKVLLSKPTLISRGFIYMKGNEEFLNKLALQTKEFITKFLSTTKLVSSHHLKQAVSEYLQTIINELTHRKPMILPFLLEV